MQDQRNNINPPPFSYVRALESYARQHPSQADITPSPSISRRTVEPSDRAIVPDQGATQLMTASSLNLPQVQTPSIPDQLRQALSLRRAQNAPPSIVHLRSVTHSQVNQDASQQNEPFDSSSSHFSSVSRQISPVPPIPSPFTINIQQRLDRLRGSDLCPEAHLYYSTPNDFVRPGVNHHPSSNMHSRQMVEPSQRHDYRVITNADRTTDASDVGTKMERKESSIKSEVNSLVQWPPPPPRILPSGSVSTVSKQSSRVTAGTDRKYYNLISSDITSLYKDASIQVSRTPVPMPRQGWSNHNPREPILPPMPFASAPARYQRVERCRNTPNQDSYQPMNLPPRTNTSRFSSHALNDTALVPITSQHSGEPSLPSPPSATQSPNLPVIPKMPGVTYAKVIQKKYGLKPESAAALIPPFQTPCCLWAEKVRRVLYARGFSDLDDPWLTFALLPFVLGKLPSNIAQMVPTNSLAYMLDFVESYDRRTNSLHDVLTKNITPSVKPSAAFLQRCNDMRRARGPDLDNEAIFQLAWQSLSTSLPPQLQPFVLTIKGSNELPTARQWEIMDNLWFDTLSKQELATKLPLQAVAAEEPNTKTTKGKNTKRHAINTINNRVNQLSEKIDQTLAQVTATKEQSKPAFTPRNFNSTPRNTVNYSLGIPLKERGVDLTRYPNAPYPQRLDLCFYHQAFGKDAFKCNIGCGWINRTGKPLRQVPIRTNNNNNNTPGYTPPSTAIATVSTPLPKNA